MDAAKSRELELGTDQLIGRFFPSEAPGPGVLALSGSDGGCPVEVGRRLAAEGMSCLALRYFKAAGLPRTLVEVPLDYIGQALSWLRRQPSVAGDRLGVVGVSKGAELALLTATYFPRDVGAVAAYAPSAVVFAGISFGGAGRRRSSWSYRGEPVPFVPYAQHARPGLGVRGFSLSPIYRAALEDEESVESAAIKVENADTHLLLISGGRDAMWPSSAMADMVCSRLRAHGMGDHAQHLRFPGAGHSFMPWMPELPAQWLAEAMNSVRLLGIGGAYDFGGSPSANRNALQEAWPRTVSFLRDKLA